MPEPFVHPDMSDDFLEKLKKLKDSPPPPLPDDSDELESNLSQVVKNYYPSEIVECLFDQIRVKYKDGLRFDNEAQAALGTLWKAMIQLQSFYSYKL